MRIGITRLPRPLSKRQEYAFCVNTVPSSTVVLDKCEWLRTDFPLGDWLPHKRVIPNPSPGLDGLRQGVWTPREREQAGRLPGLGPLKPTSLPSSADALGGCVHQGSWLHATDTGTSQLKPKKSS